MMSSKLGPVQGQDSQTLGAQDATISTIQALLTRYDTQIVDKFNEETVLFDLFPHGTADPALDTLSWKIRKAGKIPSRSRDGNQQNIENAAFDVASNGFYSINQEYELTNEDIERAKLSDFNIDSESSEGIGKEIAKLTDYDIWNGVVATAGAPAMTGIKAGAQDTGNPGGVWDTSTNLYDDVLKILALIDNKGYSGPIDIVMTPGLKKLMRQFVSFSATGTTAASLTVEQWIVSQLSGGRVFFTSHPFTLNTGPTTTDKATGTDGTATNWFVAIARDSFKVVPSRALTSVSLPAASNNIKRNLKMKYTVKTSRTDLISYMDAIDALT